MALFWSMANPANLSSTFFPSGKRRAFFADWLLTHSDVERISRDRAGSYPEDQNAVDYLSNEGFLLEQVSIAAEELRFVEQATGRKGYG